MVPDGGRPSAVFLPTFALAGGVLGWLAAGDVGFRDAGEIGTAAFGLGVAHPTGFAVDLLVLRAASFLPLGSIAVRQNLAVAMEAALALATLAALTALLAARLGVHAHGVQRTVGALAALALLGWQTFLGTALTTEVYSLSLWLVLLAAYGALAGGAARGVALCVVGLAPGLHVTAGLYAGLAAAATLLGGSARSAIGFVRARLPALLACALVVLYLPLASRRDPALDWGDPETLARVLDHLTAARIRDAYAADMLAYGPSATLVVVEQWLELGPLLPFALFAALRGLGISRAAVLGPLGLLVADLAYAAWINPMGAADRQVGHVAGAALCVLGGLGVALGWQALAVRWQRGVWLALSCAVFATPLSTLPRAELGDDFAASELHGSGGPLAALPPRAVLVCSSDDGCAGGLFALYVEGVRPDVDVVPAQHLWDPTVLRHLRGALGQRPRSVPAPDARAAAASAAVVALAQPGGGRPVSFAGDDALRRAGLGRIGAPAPSIVPYLATRVSTVDGSASVAALDRLRAARFGAGGPSSERARSAWSAAYDGVGTALLAHDQASAVRALRAAAAIAPARATAWVNLGVALEARGQLEEAARCAVRAARLDPARGTAWVNLARLQLRIAGPDAAARVVELARRAGVQDARLDALAQQLGR